MQQLDIVRSDINLERASKEQKIQEKLEKNEIGCEKALDEINAQKEQLRHFTNERKRDIDETADFVKVIIDQQKKEVKSELSKLRLDYDTIKKEVIDRCSIQEMMSIKQSLTSHIDSKVDIKEVQGALNDCQSDLAEQLTEFKSKISEKIKNQEISLSRIIERKVDHKDLQMVIDSKADNKEVFEKFAFKQEHDMLQQQTSDLMQLIDQKLDKESFVSFDKTLEDKLKDVVKQLGRKSNIKDVCALLDMKSSKCHFFLTFFRY